MPADEVRDWFEIEPKDATRIVLPRDDIRGPINELGEPCPWPWDPPQLAGARLGQYHCPYCGGMQIAGERHLDWTDVCEVCCGGRCDLCADAKCRCCHGDPEPSA